MKSLYLSDAINDTEEIDKKEFPSNDLIENDDDDDNDIDFGGDDEDEDDDN